MTFLFNLKKKKDSRFLMWIYASSILIGTAIGAGILGLPYALKDNLKYGFYSLLLISLIIIITNLMLSELMYKSKKKHQLSGYINEFLGLKGKFLMTITFSISIYGAILAYITGIGQILSSIVGFSVYFWYMVQILVVFMITSKGINYLKRFELSFTVLLLSFIIFISIYSIKSNLFNVMNFHHSSVSIFSMLGIALFAFINTLSLPEVNEVFKFDKNYKRNLFIVIFISTLIPLLIYSLFAYSLIGIGASTNSIATLSLIDLFGSKIGLLVNAIAVFSMTTSFLTLSFASFQMYFYDYSLDKNKSLLFTFLIPVVLLLFVIHFKSSFVDILDFTGNIAGSLQGLLIVFSYFVFAKSLSQSLVKKVIRYFLVFLLSLFYLTILYFYLFRIF